MDLVLKPVRIATSKPARQTYLNTLLFVIASTILLAVAIVAYVIFYFNYVPQIGVERVLHLQYGDGPHPYGVAALSNSLIPQQPYDIHLSLHLPRSPPNIAQGNFMLSLSLLGASYTPPLPTTQPRNVVPTSPTSSLSPADLILLTRRPAILKYASRLVSLGERLFALPFYILGLRSESETLSISMAESATFLKGANKVPAYVLLELQAGQDVQVYDVRVRFTARFGGMRWLMYNYRLISLFAFTATFWIAEVLFTIIGWLAVRTFFGADGGSSKTNEVKKIKQDETDASITLDAKHEEGTDDDPDISDTPRSFPTYGRQKPLRYEPKVKDEDSEDYMLDETVIPPLEADDEDEEAFGGYKGREDSGLGTSYSEGGGRGTFARRRSRGGKGT